jgi:hypothetical protein
MHSQGGCDPALDRDTDVIKDDPEAADVSRGDEGTGRKEMR